MDLIVSYVYSLFVILCEVVSPYQPPPGLHGFVFLSCYDLWPVLKISISSHQPLCMPQHIQSVLSQLREGGWSAVNNQLFGHSWDPRTVLFMRKNLEGPVGS